MRSVHISFAPASVHTSVLYMETSIPYQFYVKGYKILVSVLKIRMDNKISFYIIK